MDLPREGELTWYDRSGWAHPSTFRVTSRWLILTTEDGESLAFERADLAAVLNLPAVFVDGDRVTPGTRRCTCTVDCWFPCWQRVGLTTEPCCPACPPLPATDDDVVAPAAREVRDRSGA